MKKILSLVLVSMLAMGATFAMPMNNSCLQNFTDKQVQRMELIQEVLTKNTEKFETKFPGAKVEIQKLTQHIDHTTNCNGGFENFEEFNNGVKAFIHNLLAKKLVATPNTDPAYTQAVKNLQQTLTKFFSLGMEQNTFEYYDFDNAFEMIFSSKTTNGADHENIDVKANFEAQGKGAQTDLKIDATVKGGISGMIDNQTTFGDEIMREKGDGGINLDMSIKMDKEDLYFSLNDLTTELNIDNPFMHTIIEGKTKEITEKLNDKTIHIPLPEEFSTQYTKNLMLAQRSSGLDILKVMEYGNKKTIIIDTQICSLIGNATTVDKESCIDGINYINQRLQKVGDIKKLANGNFEIYLSGNTNDYLSIVWNEDEIISIKGNLDGATINYENKYLTILIPEMIKISGTFDPKNGVDLQITDINTKDEMKIKGILKTSRYELTADFNTQFQKGDSSSTDSRFYLKITNMFHKISSFTFQKPTNILEIEEVAELFSDSI